MICGFDIEQLYIKSPGYHWNVYDFYYGSI